MANVNTKAALLATLAPSIKVVIAGTEYTALLREFSTGSIGYNVSGKLPALDAEGKATGHKVQVGLNLIVCGSKDFAAE
jgi:hypothetical protein